MIYSIVSLILNLAAGLLATVCLLRIYMQYHRISMSLGSGNPLSSFIFAASNWLVLPLRKKLPPLGRVDTSSLVAAYLIVLVKTTMLWIFSGLMGEWAMLFLIAVFALLTLSITALSWLIIAYALLSLVRADSDLSFVLEQMVNPLLNPIRRFIPLLGGVDLSPIAFLLILQILEVVLRYVEQSI